MKIEYRLKIDAASRTGQDLCWYVEGYELEDGQWIRIVDESDGVIAEIPIEEWEKILKVVKGIQEWVTEIEVEQKKASKEV